MNCIRIYVASSWRNPLQQEIVARLREEDFEVYDFKNPPGRTGFAWSDIDPDWQKWNATQFVAALGHPIAQAGFSSDMGALAICHACVCVLPCGRSAHLELGHAVGAGKFTAVLLGKDEEPELMYRMCDLVTDDIDQIIVELVSRFGMTPCLREMNLNTEGVAP